MVDFVTAAKTAIAELLNASGLPAELKTKLAADIVGSAPEAALVASDPTVTNTGSVTGSGAGPVVGNTGENVFNTIVSDGEVALETGVDAFINTVNPLKVTDPIVDDLINDLVGKVGGDVEGLIDKLESRL